MATKRATKKAPSKMEKVKGVTEMTKEKHKFEGFAVRAQKGGYHFRQYVSASAKLGAPKTVAYQEAVNLRNALQDVLDEKKNWRASSLTKAALSVITKLGFKIEQVATA